MQKIKNENEALRYWTQRYKRDGHCGWGSFGQWAEQKCNALRIAWDTIGFKTLLDIGCGDLSVISSCKTFKDREFSYSGLDGSEEIISMCKVKFPDINFVGMKISDLVKSDINTRFDMFLCFDVIFHIVEDELCQRFLYWLFNGSSRGIALSFLRSNNEYVGSERGHFIVRNFSNFSIPSTWEQIRELGHDRLEFQRLGIWRKR